MYDAVVLGAGVYGLSIATELTNRGLKVAVVARDLPEDLTSTGFASPWAGCNWCSFETDGNTPAAEWDAITFKALGRLAEEYPNMCKKIPFYDVWTKDLGLPWYADLVFNAELLKGTPSKPLPGGFPHGVKFESYILHAPDYLAHLASGLRSRGLPIIRRRLASLDEAYDLPEVGRVDLVVNALALGNKTLIGVEDDNMYPAQGQTVLVRAPLVNTCTMSTGDTVKSARTAANDDAIAYIIPRPGPDGHVVCGGTYNRDNWITQPSMAEAERILRACYALDPRLAGPNGTSWKDIEVVAHNVGLRPSRDGGVRLELEHRELVGAGEKSVALAPTSRSSQGHRQVAVVHAYGPGGTGYQSSIGLATKAADIVMGQVKNVPPRAKL